MDAEKELVRRLAKLFPVPSFHFQCMIGCRGSPMSKIRQVDNENMKSTMGNPNSGNWSPKAPAPSIGVEENDHH